MPHSYSFFKEDIKQWFINNIPPGTKILDVGPGEGTYADLLEGLGYEMHGVEIYEPYVDRFYLRSKYKKVHINDVMNFRPALGSYNFVILGDVLEHLTEADAKILIQDIKDRQMGCLVAVPYMMEQGEWEGNIHETHHQPDLTQDNVLERYPDLELLYANEYYGYYKMKDFKNEKAYVLYCTESYADTTQACVNSIRKYSSIPIYVYMLGSDKKIEGANTIKWGTIKYDTKKNKFIDRKQKHLYEIMSKRPDVVTNCLNNYAKTVAYVDCDSVATEFVDRIFDLYPYNCSHPYFVRGIYDWLTLEGKGGAESYEDLTGTLEHDACILFNVNQRKRIGYRQTGYFVAGQWTLEFMNEWKQMCKHIDVIQFPEKYAPYQEETIANVLLWKKGIHIGLPYIYVNGSLDSIDRVKNIGFNGLDNHVEDWFQIPSKEEDLLFYHGEKDPEVMQKMIDKLDVKKPLRVLFLAPHLSTGGMPAFLLKRIELLQKYTDVDVYVVEYQNYSAEYVVHKNKINKLTQVMTLGTDKMQLMNIIKSLSIDVVHIDEMIEGFDDHNKVPEELMKALYAPDRTWRIVETCHNVWFNPDQNKRYHPDGYAFCTPYHMETFANMPSTKRVIEFPISDLRNHDYGWDQILEELGLDITKEHVVNVGLWTPGKNQKEAVELARQMPDVQFHFIGNQAPNFKDYWEPIMADLPTNCKVWGERDDAWKFMSIADVFMFNSTWECNPLVLREAIGYRCKILARNLPQYCGMFDDYIIPIDENNLKKQLYGALVGNVDYEIPIGQDLEFAANHVYLYTEVKNKPPQESLIQINISFIRQPFLEITGNSNDNYTVRWFDGHYKHDNLVYESIIGINSWTKLNCEYYKDWAVEVLRNGKELVYSHRYNCENKRVYIAFDSASLGDTIAWIPYCLEFKKKHNCHVIVSTFKNNLFKDVYPELEFIEPGTPVNNIYAMYTIGWFYDENKEPELPNTIPLQKTATNILGLEYEEIVPRINFSPGKRPYKKYITIATNSTAGCKFWTREAWQELINYYTNEGYKVVNVSLEDNPFDNCIVPEDKSIENTMNLIYYSKFFVGLSSGLSWLAWTLKKDVVMISNFTQEDHEFKCIRITNKKVCNGCWNKPEYKFDRGDWNWCPVNKGTDKQFECQTSITAQMVIDELEGRW